jgi:hypothetical protein
MTKAIACLESGRVCPGPHFEGFEGTGNMGDELNHSPLINPFLITCFVKLLLNNAQSTEIKTQPRTFFQGKTHWSFSASRFVKRFSRHEREHLFSECCGCVVRRTILLRGSCSVNGWLTFTSPSMSGVEPCSRIKQLMMN